jgi:hypothetical protein
LQQGVSGGATSLEQPMVVQLLNGLQRAHCAMASGGDRKHPYLLRHRKTQANLSQEPVRDEAPSEVIRIGIAKGRHISVKPGEL